MEKNWKEYIKGEEEKYKKLGHIKCPAFGNEEIYFNRYGFSHLVYKGRFPRPQDEVIKRFELLPYVIKALKNTKSICDEEKRTKGSLHAYFWTIRHRINNKTIRIILRRLGDTGTLHFLSVMAE